MPCLVKTFQVSAKACGKLGGYSVQQAVIYPQPMSSAAAKHGAAQHSVADKSLWKFQDAAGSQSLDSMIGVVLHMFMVNLEKLFFLIKGILWQYILR